MLSSKRRSLLLVTLAATIVGSSLLLTSAAGHRRTHITPIHVKAPIATNIQNIADRVFLLLKTGVEVAYDRLPAHVATTLKRYPTHAVYADTDDIISGVRMIDCLSFLDEDTLNRDELLAYRLRRQSRTQLWNWGNGDILVDKEKTGWKLDRFKNMPAFAHAWIQDASKDWYVMIDADSYIFARTLEFVTSRHDPDDIIYLGKAVGAAPFAHGGSGIVLSRGAMRAIFGKSHKDTLSRLKRANQVAAGVCCGDKTLALVLKETTGMQSGTLLDHTELAQFQGAQVSTVYIPTSEQWCNAAPTFHELPGWEVYKLSKWEADCDEAGLSQTYSQYYHDFIKQQVSSELKNWVFHDGNYDGADKRIDVRKYDASFPEAHEKKRCIRKCAESEDCMMWTYLGGEICKNFHNAVSPGSKMSRHSPTWDNWTEVASGYMVDRIRAFRLTQLCEIERDEQDGQEGWFIEQLMGNFGSEELSFPSRDIIPSLQ